MDKIIGYLKNIKLDILDIHDKKGNVDLRSLAGQIDLVIEQLGQGGSGQLETVVSPEILSAIEYGYRQCEKGKNLQETLENARG